MLLPTLSAASVGAPTARYAPALYSTRASLQMEHTSATDCKCAGDRKKQRCSQCAIFWKLEHHDDKPCLPEATLNH